MGATNSIWQIIPKADFCDEIYLKTLKSKNMFSDKN